MSDGRPTAAEPATAVGASAPETGVGSVFVSNYPPYSFWTAAQLPAVERILDEPPRAAAGLGVYVHVPFCRKRCKFCYFRVYTDRTAADVRAYLDAVGREVDLYAARRGVAGRPVDFVYFGGGTPSFLGAPQLRGLVRRLTQALPWDAVQEVTFECEPGTLTRPKLEAIRELGITRLSLGVENFDDAILEHNGRAHTSKEIRRVAPWIRQLAFDQVNVDLISGMIGESWDTWRDSVRKTVDLGPDSVTIYQMELPYNTEFSRQVLAGSGLAVADWPTKRDWHAWAIDELERQGYEISSAYTMIRKGSGARFVYRDSVWRGSDLVGLGVSSFSHVGGVHFQNVSNWEPYLARLENGALPLERAFVPSDEERLTRETILQLKLGALDPEYFRRKFGVSIRERFAAAWDALAERGMLEPGTERLRLTRQGLLRVDTLLPQFYAPQYQNARYT